MTSKYQLTILRRWHVLYAIPLLCLPAITTAQIYVDVSLCRNITDDTSRVQCYDYLVQKAMSEQEQQVDNSRLMQENRAMRAELARLRREGQSTGQGNSELSSYGLPQETDRVVQNDDKKELFGTIAGLSTGPRGWYVTLDSGQVWRQMDGQRYLLEVGQQVRIYPTIWGPSYRLSVEKLGKYIKVERIE